MSIGGNIGSLKSTVGSTDTEVSTLDIMFKLKGVGPGDLGVGYDSRTIKDSSKYADITLVYDVSVGDGAGYQFAYSTMTTTPDGGDATTASHILGGLYASF
ncbi:MAG: hypothetical protein HQ517_14935 [SAR324 cluster bacterium]|nr:hypothetical protein [SAR324 cluster bacterium]